MVVAGAKKVRVHRYQIYRSVSLCDKGMRETCIKLFLLNGGLAGSRCHVIAQ